MNAPAKNYRRLHQPNAVVNSICMLQCSRRCVRDSCRTGKLGIGAGSSAFLVPTQPNPIQVRFDDVSSHTTRTWIGSEREILFTSAAFMIAVKQAMDSGKGSEAALSWPPLTTPYACHPEVHIIRNNKFKAYHIREVNSHANHTGNPTIKFENTIQDK